MIYLKHRKSWQLKFWLEPTSWALLHYKASLCSTGGFHGLADDPLTWLVLQDPEDDLDLQQHLSKALLQREALREDKDDVSRENVQLQLLLEHEYGLHEDCSPLPTSQAPIIFSPAAGHQHHTVIEAAHIAKYCLWKNRSTGFGSSCQSPEMFCCCWSVEIPVTLWW